MSARKDIYYLEKQEITLSDFKCDEGWILDFGGGGEGIIGHIKGSRVIAIDKYKGELIEALERGCKALFIVMDGTELTFLDNTFPTATAFYSLMYVKESEELERIFREIYRVLKPEGRFFVWDGNFALPNDPEKEIIAFKFSITLPTGKLVETGYATRKTAQSFEEFLSLSEKVGFELDSSQNSEFQFHMVLRKP